MHRVNTKTPRHQGTKKSRNKNGFYAAFLCALVSWCLGVYAQTPARLTDQEYWKLSSESSEPGGSFHSENLVSNEIRFQTIIPALTRSAAPGRAYIGVGSEQNFTYIAAVRPAIAFIIDIR